MPPAASQASVKTMAIAQAAGPSTCTCVSRQGPPRADRLEPYSSPMFIPPVNAVTPSMTRIFRWSRNGWSRRWGKSGLKSRTSMPRSRISFQKVRRVATDPKASARTRTMTPRATARPSVSSRDRPVLSSLKM